MQGTAGKLCLKPGLRVIVSPCMFETHHVTFQPCTLGSIQVPEDEEFAHGSNSDNINI